MKRILLPAFSFLIALASAQARAELPLLEQKQDKPQNFGCRFEVPTEGFQTLWLEYDAKKATLEIRPDIPGTALGNVVKKPGLQYVAKDTYIQLQKDGKSVVQFEKKAHGLNHEAAYQSGTYGTLNGLCYFDADAGE